MDIYMIYFLSVKGRVKILEKYTRHLFSRNDYGVAEKVITVKTLSEVSNDSLTQQVNNISHTGKRIILHNWVFIFSSSKETSTVLKKNVTSSVSK